ncbi:hypothetical protein ACHHYP_07409 [Achlya hypogyna]|uniref:Uncharacterized protein n=1 Tax=Achlya hypogyna TaxID=1202772 RepID=A0A1V9ZM29_ACHHY|nr:hypothetical protein ACHHYP_07409 [Achlya hypogyna]
MLTTGLVGGILCLWFSFEPAVSIAMMLCMFALVSYASNNLILCCSPVHLCVAKDDDDGLLSKPQAPRDAPLEKQAWHVPTLEISEMLMNNSNNTMQGELVQGQAIWANSDEPIAFENDLFRGKILFLLRTEPESPKWHHLFTGRRRLFWVQLQGQFKVQPVGTVYIGGEVPRKMTLGFINNTLVRILLSVLNCLVVGLHYGLGQAYPKDVVAPEDEELPHLCFPLQSSVDEFMCTRAGDPVPPLGTDGFGESADARAKRKAGTQRYEFNTTDTYSFSFFSFFIDFERWKVVNVPGMPDTSLATFWNSMPLRIVAYSLKTPSSHRSERHVARQKQYYLCLQLSPTPHNVRSRTARSLFGLEMDAEAMEFLKDEEAHHDQLLRELDVFVFSVPAWVEYFSTTEGVKGAGERRVGYLFDILEYTDGTHTTLKKHRFALHTAVQTNLPISLASDDMDADDPSVEFTIQTKTSSSRAIDAERVAIDAALHAVAAASGTGPASLARKIAAKTALKRLLTQPSSVAPHAPFFATRPGISTGNQGQVLRMVWDSHWRNEWLVLDTKRREIRFFRTQTSTPCLVVPIADIFDVTVASDYLNLPPPSNSDGMYWFEIETLTRVHCIAVASLGECEFWHRSIVAEMDAVAADGHTIMTHDLVGKPYHLVAGALGRDRFHKELLYGLRFEDDDASKRRVLNDRRIGVRFGASADLDICDVVEQAVRMAILLRQHPRMCLTHEVLMFLDVVASIKQVNKTLTLEALSVPERTAFFLNLYHLQMLHGHFLEILPLTKAAWTGFFNGVVYAVAGHLFSPAEIEHCVLRAPLPPMKPPVPGFVVPAWTADDPRTVFELPAADYRMAFALNPTTRSSVAVITVYRGAVLEHQLNFMARVVLSTLVSADMRKHIIYLPRVCDWCAADFPGHHQVGNVVRTLVSFLDGDLKANVEALLSQPSKLAIKYLSYDYSFHQSIALSSWRGTPP